jgi:chemotaxis response regulator CheB
VIRVLVVEDDASARSALRTLVSADDNLVEPDRIAPSGPACPSADAARAGRADF